MKIDQVIKEQQKGERRIDEVFRETCRNKCHHLDHIRRIRQIEFHKSLPRYTRDYLRGYETALFHLIQMEFVYWGFFYDGKMYEDWNSLPDAAKELVKRDELKGQHYWIDQRTHEKTHCIW